MVSEEKKNFYKKFLYEPFPVESSLAGQLTDHLNAEIASGTLTKQQHCIDYLTWTYFFRRLTKNPSYYGLVNEGGKIADTINKYLKNLVEENLQKLVDAKCVEYNREDESVTSTTLGYLASFYYLSHETIKDLGNQIGAETPIDELIAHLSNAKEFAGLPVRHNEDVLNEALAHLVPIKVPKHDMESPHVKSNLLLQAHFERCPLPITDFITDTKSVLDQSIRIIQGMIDIASHKGYLTPAMNLVHLLQMIIQGQWLDQSPLINVPHLTEDLITKLAKAKIQSLPQLIRACKGDMKDLFDNKLKHPIPTDDLREMFQALEKVPIVKLMYSVIKSNDKEELQSGELLEEGGEATIFVNLKRTNKAHKQFAYISNFPKPKECTWFLMVGHSKTNELIALKRISFTRFASKKVQIVLPVDFSENMEIFLMCDSYIGLDQRFVINFNNVNDSIRMGKQN